MTDAGILLGQGATHVTFEWGRIQTNTDWILPIAATVLILLFVRAMYVRDAEELPRPVGLLLAAHGGVHRIIAPVPPTAVAHRTRDNSQLASRDLATQFDMGITDAGVDRRGASRAAVARHWPKATCSRRCERPTMSSSAIRRDRANRFLGQTAGGTIADRHDPSGRRRAGDEDKESRTDDRLGKSLLPTGKETS